MNWQDYITADPAVLVGKPVIKGTRLSVEFILGLLAQGWPEADILANYHISREQLLACVGYAQARISEEKVFATAVGSTVRLCANENLPELCIRSLRTAGHDVLWIREAAPGSSDTEVLSLARAQERLLLTFDKDFGELVFHKGRTASHGVVLFRFGQASAARLAERIVAILSSRTDWLAHFSVVEEHSIRMRRLT